MKFINYFTPESINQMCKKGIVRIRVTLSGFPEEDIVQHAIDGKTGEPVTHRTEWVKFEREVEIGSWEDLFQLNVDDYDRKQAYLYNDKTREGMR